MQVRLCAFYACLLALPVGCPTTELELLYFDQGWAMDQSSQLGPARLSVIFVTPNRYEIVQRTVRCLQQQTIRSQLEIIIVAPSEQELFLDHADLELFHSCKVVGVGLGRSAGDTRVAGLKQATAPIVAYIEDHAFPANNKWAEALLLTHQELWGAVAPTLRNGNPESVVSWASFLLCFGAWSQPQSATAFTDLPWRNVSYRRSVLLEYGDELADLFVAESRLHRDLISRGYMLLLDPCTVLYHLNFTSLELMLQEQFTVGRVFARARSKEWSMLRRMLYVGGGALIPIAKLSRLAPGLAGDLRRHRLLPQIIPSLTLGLLASCLGEWTGYLLGLGGSVNWELNKIEVSPDRQLLSGSTYGG